MNPSQSEQSPTPRRKLWRWIAVAAGAGVLLVALSLWNFLTLSRESMALRKELFAALPLPASPQVQISVGPIALGVARTALAVIPDVPPEARQALRALRAASVGVYQLHGSVEPSDRVNLVTAADRAMAQRRWTRVVGVNEGRDTVLVYMPADFVDGAPLRVCLAVCAEDKLVLVSAVGHGDELLELVQQHHRLTEL
jgi:hypothetical protein